MKILITGDNGFVGTATKKVLDDFGIDYCGYDLMDGADIRDKDQFEAVIQEELPDRILHLAAIARFSEADSDPYLTYQTNMRGTENVAEVANKYHIPVVYASTGSTYMPIQNEPPIKEDWPVRGNSVYGSSKAIGETIIQQSNNPHIILRYAHLYGREKRFHGLIGGFLDRIKRGLAPTLYGGSQSNDFTYIKDVARANMLALTADWDKWNEAYNIGTGEEITAREAGEIICELSGWEEGMNVEDGREVDPQRFVYDMTKAKTMLGFEAEYDFEQGLTDMFSDEVLV